VRGGWETFVVGESQNPHPLKAEGAAPNIRRKNVGGVGGWDRLRSFALLRTAQGDSALDGAVGEGRT
jgi:hypothetical protein